MITCYDATCTQLMRRMLKRKIHPEIEDKINKASSSDQTHQIGTPNHEGFEGFEALSLLPIQGKLYTLLLFLY